MDLTLNHPFQHPNGLIQEVHEVLLQYEPHGFFEQVNWIARKADFASKVGFQGKYSFSGICIYYKHTVSQYFKTYNSKFQDIFDKTNLSEGFHGTKK